MLIQSNISYAELMIGMIDARIDNNSKETNTLYQYYDEITKDMDISIWCLCINGVSFVLSPVML